MKLSTIFGLTAILAASPTLALFSCNKDQHAFPPTPGKFVVHYTAKRDSSFPPSFPDSWIRICKPNANGGFDYVKPLSTSCNAGHPITFSKEKTTLDAPFKVTNGNGCDGGSIGNLDNAAFDYKGQHRNLGDAGASCGPRNHGISCQFDL